METDAVRVIGVLTTAVAGAINPTSMREETVRMSGGDTLAVPPPAAVPVMVREWTPTGVAPASLVVVIVIVEAQVVHPDAQDVGVNDADAPTGRPNTAEGAKVIASAAPLLVLVAVMILALLVAAPWSTEMSLSFARVKVKAGVAVMESGKVVVLPRGPLSVTVMVRGVAVIAAEAGTARDNTISLAHDEPTVAGGAQDEGENDAITPAGRPATLLGTKETAEGAPELVVTCMV